MDKIYLIDKVEGISSFDVVFKLRKKFNIKKIGHTGTLDPFATGLLILCCGEATKISNYILSSKKTYVATLKLGVLTDTLDKDGKVVETKEVPTLTEGYINEVFNSFKGHIKQVPPQYSAIKKDGVRLYSLARQGIEVEVEPRDVEIEDLKLIGFNNDEIVFEVTCSKGTYVRSLGRDIAEKMGTCGHLLTLRRTAIDNFDISKAKKIEDIEEDDGIDIKDALPFKKIYCTDKLLFDVKNGKKLKLNETDEYLLMLEGDTSIAIYYKENNIYRSARGLNICK